MQLTKISITVFYLFLIFSCTLDNNSNTIIKNIVKKSKITDKDNNSLKIENKNISPIYLIGKPYFIDGIQYIPEENYDYSKIGLASYYGPELHRKKTINNEYNKVTELLARHKTLPLPSVVKIINLENGLSVIARVNDRGPQDNAKIIEVSRKVAQLLRFYNEGIARVRVEILEEPSKQLKIVTQSRNDPNFNKTLIAVPTESVTITNLDENINDELDIITKYEQPIEIGNEIVNKTELFVKINDFNSYQEAQNVIKIFKKEYKITTQKENKKYSTMVGPMNNQEADDLFHSLINKGYMNTEIIIINLN